MPLTAAILAALLAGCSGDKSDPASDDSGETSDSPVDDDTAPTGETADTATEACADVPTVTWANFGESFIRHNCQGCHASTTPDRHGAPEDAVFDTVEQVWAAAADILEAVAGDTPTMPPQGGVTEDEVQKLRWWLECAEPGT